MRYVPRLAEDRLRRLARNFRAVLVIGARQVGKTTLLAHTFPDLPALVFDPVQDLYGERRDPDLFLDSFHGPRILDEVQYAPGVLAALKRRVDRSDAPGQYFLTGSQNLAVLRDVAESLAGRVGILHLDAMTLAEMEGRGARSGWLAAYLERPEAVLEAVEVLPRTGSLARVVWRGGMPGLLGRDDDVVTDFHRSYVQTYVERDLRRVADVRDLGTFGRFLSVQAALTAQEINDAQAGRDLGISPATNRAWRDLLVATYQWREVFPLHGNALKRVAGKRKGLLADTGLAAHLQRLSTPEAVVVSPQLGALFETWVANEVLRTAGTLVSPPQCWHWRTVGGAEVDLVLERDGRYFPIEVKAATTLSGHDTRGLRAFREAFEPGRVAPGVIVYGGSVARRLDENVVAIPWNAA